ncbi:MAG: ribonuclease R [Saprospiraceae bacterium]|nr:ribonuclease R [Saprospiraceae bacterium]
MADNDSIRNNKGRKLTTGHLSNQALNLFAAHPHKKYNAKQVIEKLKISNSKDSVLHVLKALGRKSFLVAHKEDFFQWNKENISLATKSKSYDYYTGRVDLTRTGAAYVIVDNLEHDIYVPERNTGNAMHRDIVKVEVPKRSSRQKPEGKIIEVITRSLSHVLGTLRVFHHYSIVFPDAATRFPEVLIKEDDLMGAQDGDKVVAKITSWGQGQNKAIWGHVTTVLKEADENELAMQAILLSAGFNLEFPTHVMEEAEAISGKITKKDLQERRDFRKILTFTIDPESARDFDDAISYQEHESGNVEIGVHIADVTHFLKENSALDKEAFDRSTSVYLVDRVLPMLPEKLSNDLCSLNPNEDKFTFSAVFEFSDKGRLVNEWFGKTIIHSDRRFSYEEAQMRLESGKGDFAAELQKVNVIAHKLRKEKYRHGAINFESEEVRFVLDENKKPVSMMVKERKDAHMLIEDFMLLANRSVARFIAKKTSPEIPFVYRVHDMPDPAKLTDFALFAKEMGYSMKIDTPKHIAESFNGLAQKIAEDATFKILSPLAIRTMAKAEYSTKNIGHYGLAFEYYTHFTSPIRRYSDVLSHRILYQNLSDTIYRVDLESLEQKCKHISRQEIKASEAERESVKYKQVEYMLNHIGEEFDAQISGMIEKGIFVELPSSKAEGLIPFANFPDQYKMGTSRHKAQSKRTGHELKMGDIVRVKLVDADLASRKLEFEMIEK